MKVCSGCKAAKPVIAFSKQAAGKDGLRSKCRACDSAHGAAYRAANPEKVAARNAAYRVSNPEAIKASRVAHQAAHPEASRYYRAAYKAAHPEALKMRSAAISAAYYAANTEAVKMRSAARYASNTEKIKVQHNAWAQSHPDACRVRRQNRRARKIAAGGQLPRDITQRLLAKQKGLCACCFADLTETGYHLDHIVALVKGGAHTEGNVQLLTPRCNQEKGAKDWTEYLKSCQRIQATAATHKQSA